MQCHTIVLCSSLKLVLSMLAKLTLPTIRSFPILRNFKTPIKPQMLHVIIIHKPTYCIILPSYQHSTWRFFWRKSLRMDRFISRARWEGSDHFLVLAYWDTFSFYLLYVLKTRQDFVLDHEVGFHAVRGAFFDDEGFRFQRNKLVWRRDVYDYIGTAVDELAESVSE